MDFWKFLILSLPSWIRNVNFIFYKCIAERLPLCFLMGQPSRKFSEVIDKTLANLSEGVRMFFDNSLIHLQEAVIRYWQSFDKFFRSICNFLTLHLFARGLPVPFCSFAGRYLIPSVAVVTEFWITSRDICKRLVKNNNFLVLLLLMLYPLISPYPDSISWDSPFKEGVKATVKQSCNGLGAYCWY
jgi:hypothetical protein